MNRNDAYEAERKRVEEQLGYYVNMEQAADMIRTSRKIVSLIATYSCVVTYKEARLILRLADRALQEISGGIE